jgi:hypothetical protein
MPRKGYKCIMVTEKVHQDISQRAKESNRTIMEYVELLLKEEKTKGKEVKTFANSNSSTKREGN